MKKVVLSVVAALAFCGCARICGGHAGEGQDGSGRPAPTPWDIAFGTAFMTDYVLRGVSQSNHKPSG